MSATQAPVQPARTPVSTPSAEVINGINVTALKATIAAVSADPAKAQTTWSIHSKWVGGTRSDHQVQGYTLGGQFIQRPFVIQVDEPLELLGQNRHANPQEYLLAAINACMTVGYTAVAALMGIRLTRLEIETTGDIDLQGFLGLSDRVVPGYPELKQVVRISGDGTPEQFAKLHETVHATSPNFYNITRAVPTRSRLVVE